MKPVSENPLVHTTVNDTSSAVLMFMTGLVQMVEKILDQPLTKEMRFMIEMSLRTTGRALKHASEFNKDEEIEVKPGD